MLCGDADRADDIVQAAVTTLFARWRQVRQVDNLDAYVRRSVVNAFLSERRRFWSRVVLTEALPDQSGCHGAARADERLEIRAALRALPPKQQAVLVLRFLCDLPVGEVAELVGCSPGTVKSQTSDGLAKLRKKLGVLAPAGGGA